MQDLINIMNVSFNRILTQKSFNIESIDLIRSDLIFADIRYKLLQLVNIQLFRRPTIIIRLQILRKVFLLWELLHDSPIDYQTMLL